MLTLFFLENTSEGITDIEIYSDFTRLNYTF